VVSATAEASRQSARAKKGALWNAASKNSLSQEAFKVLNNSTPILRSPHGTDPQARTLVPLRERGGRCFGVLVSGAPALPDEFVEAMAKTAGPMLERVWKWAKVNAMMRVACTWVRKLSDRLSTVEWLEGQRVEVQPGHSWQPLFHHTGEDMKDFKLELRWSDGITLGVFQVKISEFQDISQGMLELLHSMAPLLMDTVREIEEMAVADAVATMQDFGSAYDSARMMLPRKLHQQMREQLQELNVYQILAELKGYNDVKDDAFKVVLGVLCMLGRKMKDFKDWPAVKPQLRSELIAEMISLDVRGGDDKLHRIEVRKRWAESLRATRGVDLDYLLAGGSYPVQIMTKWLLALRLVCQVVLAIEAEADPTLAEPPPKKAAPSKAEQIKKRLSLRPRATTEDRGSERNDGESLAELLKEQGEV